MRAVIGQSLLVLAVIYMLKQQCIIYNFIFKIIHYIKSVFQTINIFFLTDMESAYDSAKEKERLSFTEGAQYKQLLQ